jgi:hypothetical protein
LQGSVTKQEDEEGDSSICYRRLLFCAFLRWREKEKKKAIITLLPSPFSLRYTAAQQKKNKKKAMAV